MSTTSLMPQNCFKGNRETMEFVEGNSSFKKGTTILKNSKRTICDNGGKPLDPITAMQISGELVIFDHQPKTAMPEEERKLLKKMKKEWKKEIIETYGSVAQMPYTVFKVSDKRMIPFLVKN